MTPASDPPQSCVFRKALAAALVVHGILLAGAGAPALVARAPAPSVESASEKTILFADVEIEEAVLPSVPAAPSSEKSEKVAAPKARSPRADAPRAVPATNAFGLDDPGEPASGDGAGDAPRGESLGDLLAATGGDAHGGPRPIARGPRLLEGEGACRRFFPWAAHVDAGVVRLAVDVSSTGSTDAVRVLDERPPRDGFGPAATSCVRAFRFAPAIGGDGQPLPATATLLLEFVRRAHRRG